jgi:hypothetical protein
MVGCSCIDDDDLDLLSIGMDIVLYFHLYYCSSCPFMIETQLFFFHISSCEDELSK